MKSLHYYFIGTGTWFASHGIQNVMFAWLVAMVLFETPEKVGIAQMTMLIPAMLLMLVGGSFTDRFGGRRVAMLAQMGALIPALMLLLVLLQGGLNFTTMLIYAAMMGCAQAFVTPARDGLLYQVAEGRIQRTVVLATLTQFGVQMAGIMVAGLADHVGGAFVVACQITALVVGVLAFWRIPQMAPAVARERSIGREVWQSMRDGGKTVWASPAMRAVMLQNIAMGVFFMGSYIVTIPLLVREVYDGDASDLAIVNAANALGLVTSILWLLKVGDLRRKGRALILTHIIGSVFLAAAGVPLGFTMVVVFVYLWGACGGIAMSMSRTIMQEQAPDGRRGSVMGFFSFSFMGAGPIGALGAGYFVELIGPGWALIGASGIMFLIALSFAVGSRLWRSDQPPGGASSYQQVAEEGGTP